MSDTPPVDASPSTPSRGSARRKPRKLQRRSIDVDAEGREESTTPQTLIKSSHGSDVNMDQDKKSSTNSKLPKFALVLDQGDDGSMDEGAMQRHLMDVESSFMPDQPSEVPEQLNDGNESSQLDVSAGSEQNDDEGHIARQDVAPSPSSPSAQRQWAKSPPMTPSRSQSETSTIKSAFSPHPEQIALPHSDLMSFGSPNSSIRNSLTHRPSYLSSVSEGASANSGDAAGGVRTDATARPQQRLPMTSRLPSLGSVVSYTDRAEVPPGFGRGSSYNRRGTSLGNVEEGDPETPRGGEAATQNLSDTVLAQHVDRIHVPDTVARDFRAQNRSTDPQPNASMGFGDRARRTLTLKEQNNKMDMLTKENFELKLKIHFLDQALQKRSDDGVKELIDQNVQFQTDLANANKELTALRRKARDQERRLGEQDKAMAELRRQKREEEPVLQAEMHEEILVLRQQLDYSKDQASQLRDELMAKEQERVRMTERMRSLAGSRGHDAAGLRETMDMWQDLLHAETGRREQAEEDMRRLREELTALRIEHASPMPRESTGRPHTSEGVHSDAPSDWSSTRIEQLRHENAELRRDLGAQTSMLTSRNRERERLQQEIEDLKLLTRKTVSVAGESIFERSVSRARQRAQSRASEAVSSVPEAPEDWERKEGMLRDQNAELRLKYQELERTHGAHLRYVSAIEGDFEQMEKELNEAREDVRAIQAERDELLQACDEKEKELQELEDEATAEMQKLQQEKLDLDGQLQEAQRLWSKAQSKLERTADDYRGLQGELRSITQSVMNLEDEKLASQRTMQTLEQQLAEAETELQTWENKVAELEQKNRKLEITQESLHGEISFLREEQESDKIKIGELADALDAAQQAVQDGKDRLQEMEAAMAEERQQRDVLENQSREEVQRVLDDLNSENSKAKDELRQLRRSVSAKEVEATTNKQRLDELERALREILGEPNGNRQTLLSEVERLQRELEQTSNRLDRAQMDVADRDRLLRHRDGLLESTSLESRRLSDLLDKERASRKHDLDQFDRASRGQATHLRELAHSQARVLELETAFSQDKRKMAKLEQEYHDQLEERNDALLEVWKRLAAICGPEWTKKHSSVLGQSPSTDIIHNHLGAFKRNLITALSTIEALTGRYETQMRQVEKNLWREYQGLNEKVKHGVRRVGALEEAVAAPQGSNGQFDGENARLKAEIKSLKSEIRLHRQQHALTQQTLQSQQQHGDLRRSITGGSNSLSGTSPGRALAALLRHSSVTSNTEAQSATQRPPSTTAATEERTSSMSSNEQRWIHRFKELETRLKAERERRLQDRRDARHRLEEQRQEYEELKARLEKERLKNSSNGTEGN
ncbi:hypothetical protein K470DRAFT_254565 [Piedraia hortae CBS 480.64]|uniref:Centrosomin N-terminal motif 1 domain-containing protein n=1 Tax=Piedraia hortae CBS 480.64 TaxID=1314780 RepID=A0A6A7CAL0_9PEZI|nr:hypothetical protein K470DRAFT_254565 [Piedraia hortae CBS 480.64]